MLAGPAAAPAGPRRSARTAAAGKIRSLADLGDSEDDQDSDEANEYYAGGEKSGQVQLALCVQHSLIKLKSKLACLVCAACALQPLGGQSGFNHYAPL